MAFTELTIQSTGRTGSRAITWSAAAADGNSFDNRSHDVVLLVKNASGASVDVTIATPAGYDSLALTDLVVAVAAGAEAMIGPFPGHVYDQEDSGNSIEKAILITTSAQASVSLAAVRLGSL